MPSNFVEAVPDDKMDGKDIEVFAASEEDVRKASQIIKVRAYVHHTLTHAYTHQCMYARTHTHTHITHTYAYTSMYINTYMCTHTHTILRP